MAESTIPVDVNKAAVEGTAPATREEGRYLVPPVDIFETKDGLTVVVDLPRRDERKRLGIRRGQRPDDRGHSRRRA
jgi:HSP20 family molecular chaperone IbpA